MIGISSIIYCFNKVKACHALAGIVIVVMLSVSEASAKYFSAVEIDTDPSLHSG